MIWAWKTGKLRFLAVGENQILNTANVTYQNSQGEMVSVDSNPVAVEITGASTSSTISIQLQGRSDFSGTATFFKIFPTGNPTPAFEKNDLTFDSGGSSQVDLSALQAGNYDVQIKFPYYLSAKLTNIPSGNFSNLNFGILKAGDLLVDNQINGGDFTYLKQKILTNDTVADINADGRVDAVDFSFIYTNWGLNGQ